MEELNIEGGRGSGLGLVPTVKLSLDGNFFIGGCSNLENSIKFWEPIIEWARQYAQNPASRTNIRIELEYANSASAKCLLDFFKKLVCIQDTVYIVWICEEYDEAAIEFAEDFESLLPLTMTIKTNKDKVISSTQKVTEKKKEKIREKQAEKPVYKVKMNIESLTIDEKEIKTYVSFKVDASENAILLIKGLPSTKTNRIFQPMEEWIETYLTMPHSPKKCSLIIYVSELRGLAEEKLKKLIKKVSSTNTTKFVWVRVEEDNKSLELSRKIGEECKVDFLIKELKIEKLTEEKISSFLH